MLFARPVLFNKKLMLGVDANKQSLFCKANLKLLKIKTFYNGDEKLKVW